MFYILLSLEKPLHGYGIMNKVSDLSGGRIKLGPGTLYGALSNLLDSKLIAPVRSDENNRRKVYSITQTGVDLLEYELERLEKTVKTAKRLIR